MIYGLYLSAQGADAAGFQQAVIANNLANARTAAFKPDIPVFRAHPPFDVANLQPQVAPDTIDEQTGGLTVEGTLSDFSQGSLNVTASDLDLAILDAPGQRPAFFEIGAGRQRFLTRNGQFALDQNQRLVTAGNDPLPVLTTEGEPIEVPLGTAKLNITADGTVFSIAPDNRRAELGRLSLVEPVAPQSLIKEGNTRYVNPGKAVPSAESKVRQGAFEESGSEPVTGMVDMIQASRGFEMNMNLIKVQDEMVAQLLQKIPRK